MASAPRRSRDHLRVCGADSFARRRSISRLGSPPRVRSRRAAHGNQVAWQGITSACAEQTLWKTTPDLTGWDHLRVCGADGAAQYALEHHGGSPPRVRSRRQQLMHGVGDAGITSACAEQTRPRRTTRCPTWDHLRVCGADYGVNARSIAVSGSPPRVRSRPFPRTEATACRRITSACAEQTSCLTVIGQVQGDHLRVCGADSRYFDVIEQGQGSPPRVRSRLDHRGHSGLDGRITSACAEQTTVG